MPKQTNLGRQNLWANIRSALLYLKITKLIQFSVFRDMGSPILPRLNFDNREASPDLSLDSRHGSTSDYSSHSNEQRYHRESDNSDLITFSDDDEGDGQLFTSTLDEFNRSSYGDSISGFKFWISQTIRKLLMLFTISQEDNSNSHSMDNQTKQQLDRRIEKIRNLTKLLKRKNSAGKPYFYLLFELEAFFKNCPASFLLNCSLILALRELFNNWVENAAFEISNYDRLKFFLRRFYEDPSLRTLPSSNNRNFEEILMVWKRSSYFSDQTLSEIVESRKFVDNLYFNILVKQTDQVINQTAFPLASLVELGTKNMDFFQHFLQKFSIPMAGPFKNDDPTAPRFLFFVSSMNPADSISNSCVPIYGTFEFRLSAMRDLSHEQVFEFWRSLVNVPAWIRHFPPMFNLALDPIREQILAARNYA